jgi:hypothetical protein
MGLTYIKIRQHSLRKSSIVAQMNFQSHISEVQNPAVVFDEMAQLYVADEAELVASLAAATELTADDRISIGDHAAGWVAKVRSAEQKPGMIDAGIWAVHARGHYIDALVRGIDPNA